MPSGNTHAALTALAAGALLIGMQSSGYTHGTTAAAVIGCMAGVLITPDLDVDQPTRSNYVMYREGGLLPGVIWRLIWLPYGWAIGHRSWVSHFPVVSTLIRLAYLGLICWPLLALVRDDLRPWLYLLPWAVAGLMLSDVLHWAADITVSRVKTNLRKHRRVIERD